MARFEHNWQEEKQSAYLYRVMAKYEKNIAHQKLFNDLAIAAEKQAKSWEKLNQEQNPQIQLKYSPSIKAKIVALLIKNIGAKQMPAILSVMKIRGMSIFRDYHTEHRHLSLNTTSNLRAAVFGINDGLVSNMSFILGIAGASANEHFILIGGIACLIAGAASMGAGEFISIRSQRSVYEYQIRLEEEELNQYPEEEMEELALIYEARGVPKKEAYQFAQLMIQNPQTALNTLAREELGLNPDDLVSPWSAMFSSFIAFALGAAIPLIPFLFITMPQGLYISMILTGITLFFIGAILSLFTNKNAIFLGIQMLSVGTIAGAITYFVGKLLGVHI